jgi:hypothetical protein
MIETMKPGDLVFWHSPNGQRYEGILRRCGKHLAHVSVAGDKEPRAVALADVVLHVAESRPAIPAYHPASAYTDPSTMHKPGSKAAIAAAKKSFFDEAEKYTDKHGQARTDTDEANEMEETKTPVTAGSEAVMDAVSEKKGGGCKRNLGEVACVDCGMKITKRSPAHLRCDVCAKAHMRKYKQGYLQTKKSSEYCPRAGTQPTPAAVEGAGCAALADAKELGKQVETATPARPKLSKAALSLTAMRDDALRLADVAGSVGRAASVLAGEIGRLIDYKNESEA